MTATRRDLEQLLRVSLHEHTAGVDAPAGGFGEVRVRARKAGRRKTIGVAAAVAAVAVGIVVPLVVRTTPTPSPSPAVADLRPVALVTPPTTAPTPLSTLAPAATLDATVPLGLTPERSLIAGNDVWVYGTDSHGAPAVSLVRVDEQKVVAHHTLPHPVCSSSISSGVLVTIVTLGTKCENTLRALMPINASTLVPGATIGGADGGDVLVRDDAVYDTAGGVLERRDRATLHVNKLLKLGGTDDDYANMAADPSSTHLWVTINDRLQKKTKLVEVDLAGWKVMGTRAIDANNGGIPYGAGDEVWVGGATGAISGVRHFDAALDPGTEVFAGGSLYAFYAWTGSLVWQFDGTTTGRPGSLTCAGPDGVLHGSTPLPDTVPPAILRADQTHVYLGTRGGHALQILTPAAACAG